MLVRHYNLLDHAGRTVKLSESLPSQTGGGHCCPGNGNGNGNGRLPCSSEHANIDIAFVSVREHTLRGQ